MKGLRFVPALVAAMLFAVSAHAAPAIELSARPNPAAGVIEISGSAYADWGKRKVSVIVGYPRQDNTLPAPETLSTAQLVESIYTIEEFMCEADGSFTGAIKIDEEAPVGYYIIRFAASGIPADADNDVTVFYAGEYAVSQAVKAVNDAATPKKNVTLEQTLLKVQGALEENAQALSLDIGDERYTDNKALVSKIIYYLANGGYAGSPDVWTAYNRALAMAEIFTDSENAAQKIIDHAVLLGIDAQSGHFAGNEADIVSLAKSNIDTLGEFEGDVTKYFDCMTAIAAINKSDRENVVGIIEEYAAALSAELDEDYQKVDKYELAKAFVAKDFQTRAEVIKAFNKRVGELLPKKKPPSTDGGGGGDDSVIKIGSDAIKEVDKREQEQQAAQQAARKGFDDVPSSHWAYEAISSLSAKGIINGMGDNKFLPDETVTREQIAQMIAAAFALASDSIPEFDDVAADGWYLTAVSAVYANGIIHGISGTEFGVGDEVSRQDLMTMLYRIMQNKGYTFKSAQEPDFGDSDKIGGWARDAIAALVGEGIVSGTDGRIEPQRSCTRAEAAQLIFTVMRAVGLEV